MKLAALFRRRPAISTPETLAEFIDGNAAFLSQKGLYEYARARAGHYAKVLFGEAGFQAAIEIARWRAYPLGLAMVSEAVEGLLRIPAGERHRQQLDALRALTLSVFDKYPVPAALGAEVWSGLRGDLEQRLALIGLHPPKRAMDIPEPFAHAYFDLMPIHEKLRSAEFPTTHSYLKVTMCNIHDELEKRLDTDALAATLAGRAA